MQPVFLQICCMCEKALDCLIVAVPVIGAAAIAYFEERDYRDWREENPDGTRQQYLCEMSALTAEVIDEVLQDLPELVRPAPEALMARVPDCDASVSP